MLFFYLDESGTGLHDEHSPFFLLAAVAIQAEEWPQVDREITSLKRRLVSFAEPEDWEIKGRYLRQGQELFSGKNWPERAKIFNEVAETISELPCRIFIVCMDKRFLPKSVDSNEKLYQFTFWRMLEELNGYLERSHEYGMLLVDSRSNLHTSVQDRRLVDAYRKWIELRLDKVRFLDLPWFGFSEFYAGLQIADFSAYLADFILNEDKARTGSDELQKAYRNIQSKIQFVRIP